MKKFYLGLILVVLLTSACSINNEQTNTPTDLSDNQIVTPNDLEVVFEESVLQEDVYKGWFLFYNETNDIVGTNLNTDTYYLLKREDINKEFTMVHFNENKSAVELIELVIDDNARCIILANENLQGADDTCLNLINTMPTGLSGDRMNVLGIMDNDKLRVIEMEIVSGFPVEQW